MIELKNNKEKISACVLLGQVSRNSHIPLVMGHGDSGVVIS